jgi:hypothetical protein
VAFDQTLEERIQTCDRPGFFKAKQQPTAQKILPTRVARRFVNSNLCKFWSALELKIIWYHHLGIAIWNTLRPFGILYGPLVYLVVIWYIFPCVGTLYQEKSGNPATNTQTDIRQCLYN